MTGYQLIFSDGGGFIITPHISALLTPSIYLPPLGAQMRDGGLRGETLNAPLQGTIGLLGLPRFVKTIMAWFTHASDPFYANLLEVMYPKTVVQERDLVARRDEFRAEWHERWTAENLDFVLTVPHPLPALENGTGERASLMSAGYTFLFNLVRPRLDSPLTQAH